LMQQFDQRENSALNVYLFSNEYNENKNTEAEIGFIVVLK